MYMEKVRIILTQTYEKVFPIQMVKLKNVIDININWSNQSETDAGGSIDLNLN